MIYRFDMRVEIAIRFQAMQICHFGNNEGVIEYVI